VRLVLAAAAALILTLAPAGARDAAVPAPRHFTLVPVGEGVYAAIAKDGDPTALGNAGFVIGTDAVLVVDTFATPAAAEELASEIRRLTPLPVRWVVNTHYHYDHLGGDAVFSAAGAGVIAHENVRAWVRTENLKWRKELTAEDREMLARLVLPNVTYRDALTIWLGDRKVEIFSRPGHTGGDSVVFVPSANVVFAGDLFWRNTIPNMIDASTDAWVDTLDGFLQAYPSSTFVPGHGEVGKALEVRYFRDYVSGVRLGVARSLAEGKSGKELVDSLLALQRARFGTWAWFDVFAQRNIESTEQEIKGTKKLPKPVSEKAN
jgi:cyclase